MGAMFRRCRTYSLGCCDFGKYNNFSSVALSRAYLKDVSPAVKVNSKLSLLMLKIWFAFEIETSNSETFLVTPLVEVKMSPSLLITMTAFVLWQQVNSLISKS